MRDYETKALQRVSPIRSDWEFVPFSSVGTNLDVYKLVPKGKRSRYVYKVLSYPEAMSTQYPGSRLLDRVLLMRRVYTLYKKYLGRLIPDTHFLIAQDEKPQPTIAMIQQKAEGHSPYVFLGSDWNTGKPVFYLEEEDEARMGIPLESLNEKLHGINDSLDKAHADPAFQELPEVLQKRLELKDMFYPGNIIVQKNGSIRIVDFL